VLSNFQLLQSSSSVSAKAVAVEVFWVLNEPKIASVLVRRTTHPPRYVCIIVATWVHSFTYMVQVYWDGVLGSTPAATRRLNAVYLPLSSIPKRHAVVTVGYSSWDTLTSCEIHTIWATGEFKT